MSRGRQVRDRLDAARALDRDRRHDAAHPRAGARVVVDVDEVRLARLASARGRPRRARALFAPSGGSSWTETTNSCSRSIRASSVSSGAASDASASSRSRTTSGAAGARSSSIAARIAVDLRRRRAAAAADDAGAEPPRLRRELGEVVGRRVREDDARCRRGWRGRRSGARRGRARRAASRRARSAPPPGRRCGSRRRPRRRARRAARPPSRPRRRRASGRRRRTSSARRSGSDETLRTASIAATSSSRSKNVSSMSRSTPRPSRICACSLKSWLCSAGSKRSTSPIGPIEPRDEDVRARHLARLAREAHRRRVDPLELVLEEVRRRACGRLAPNVFVSISSAPARMKLACSATTLSGARRFASSGQRSRGTAPEISAPMPPSATIGGPVAQAFLEAARHPRPLLVKRWLVNPDEGRVNSGRVIPGQGRPAHTPDIF